jgi:uncharacterized membrane protein YkvA (DUF1232 family)
MVMAHDANSSSAVAGSTAVGDGRPPPAEPPPLALRHWLERAVKSASEAVGERYLQRLGSPQSTLRESLSSVPERLQRLSQQSRLMLEFLDDARSGAYTGLSWYSVPVAAGALLYTLNPMDLVPDALPFLGRFDDAALIALTVRLLRQDLRAYCRFKGYPEAQYFDLPS